MTQSAVVKIENVRCANLRWKSLFLDAEPDPTVPCVEEPICWCVRTQNCLGPDGQVADQSACNTNRSCYEQVE